MQRYSQRTVKEKSNQLLSKHKRSLVLNGAYCHGFTLLWLSVMFDGQEQWFYSTMSFILNNKKKSVPFKFLAIEIDFFIGFVEWAQRSFKYEHNINSFDIEKLLDLPCDLTISFLFTQAQWDKLLTSVLKKDGAICISGPIHTIGLVCRGGIFYLYDTEYDCLRPRVINNLTTLKREALKSVFCNDDVSTTRLPLAMFKLDNSRVAAEKKHEKIDKISFYKKLIGSKNSINQLGIYQTTNLQLACECGDETAVRLLLKNGADPNQACRYDWNPLLIAAAKGYASIVKLLLAAGARKEYVNSKGVTAMDLAIAHGHHDVVSMLTTNSPFAILKVYA